ncbi:MAG: 3-hydroxyacyl-CoA dehydrogenase NAD-binding domain-containing protein [Planctomycetaceae bacterium]|nr:3-hydroxyacyl-CoA dehydrogenase NAD-binding domain-containing protein [Planctomycetaceae bacterium]
MISRALKHFRIDRLSEAETVVWIDVQHKSMNVFHDEVLSELDYVVSGLESQGSGAVVFRSAKPTGFFAGADVHQIAQLTGIEQIVEVVCRGQKLFQRVADLPLRTVAAIHGPCLGGGLEFALACNERIALNDRATRLGLPETQLGIIPGWGGTQRLPQLVGVATALPLILKGGRLTAVKAWKMGLVDAIAQESDWETLISRVLTDGVSSEDRRRASWQQNLVRTATDSAVGRWLVARTAERRIRSQAHHYPALPAAIRAVAASGRSGGRGYVVERNEFAQLVNTSTCRSLLNLFLWRERARSSDARNNNVTGNRIASRLATSPLSGASGESVPQVRRIGVIGAGAMGSGIAQLAAGKGLSVVIKELTPELADAGRERITHSMDRLVSGGRMTADDRQALLDRILVTDSYNDLVDCDLVIEAVVEKMPVKRAVFASLDAVLRPDAVIASNTSALSVAEMAQATNHPQRVGGLHFFNPVHRMDLVEVIRAEHTDARTVQVLMNFARQLGKTPVQVSDTPGFLVNRVLFPGMGEAVRMVMEGADIRQIDRAARRFGLPMGPLQLIDHVGLDVAWHVATTLEDVLPESTEVIRFLGQMVGRGWLGAKSGRGFYHYSDGVRGEVNDLSALIESASLSPPSDSQVGAFLDDGLTGTQRRIVYPMINELGFCMQDGVVSEQWMADLAMILGTGFAPYTGGPLTLASHIGSDTLLNNLHVLTVRHGTRFKPSAWLVNQSAGELKPASASGTSGAPGTV